MKAEVVKFSRPVTLVGGGALDPGMLAEARALAPGLVAADGAADRLAALGAVPDLVVGDLDSIADRDAWKARAPVIHLAEQDTTDFEKCLYATEAPLYVAAGFTGRRVDHMLAVFHAMLRRQHKCVVLLGEEEVIALLPAGRALVLDLEAGAVVSLFPLVPATGIVSEGLQWSVKGLAMAPGQVIGTSNRAVADRVSVGFDGPGVLLLLPRRFLGTLVAAVAHGVR